MQQPKDLAVHFETNADIERYAVLCLKLNNLVDWSFAWDRAKRRLGSCRYLDRQITLSRHFVACNRDNENQIKDTILHEIAHALAWVHHQEKGHGAFWKQFCRELGVLPRASAPAQSVNSSPYKYHVRLKDTGEIVGRYHRKPRFARSIKRMMLKNRPETRGMLEIVPLD